MRRASWIRRSAVRGVLAGLLAAAGHAHADLYVCAQHAIRVYADDAAGPATPLRIISGADTGISECYGVALDALNGELWVAHGGLSVFRSTADGNVAPLRHLDSGLTFATAVAVHGNEVVLSGPGGIIATYDRLATGAATPLRSMDVGATIAQPAALFVDRLHDAVYLSDLGGSGVVYAYPRTATGATAPIAGPYPAAASRGISVDPTEGRVYVAGSAGVSVYAHGGGLIGQIPSGPGQLAAPWGLVLARTGTVVVGDQIGQGPTTDRIRFYLPYPFDGPVQFNFIDGVAATGAHAYGIASSDALACGSGNVVDDCVLRDGFEGGNAHAQP